jgi:hypothetical protein
MRVRRVEILRSPGIASAFVVQDFGDGLTIIEGRNESGKSTLAGAIRSLLWPARSSTLQARGVFEADDGQFRSFVDAHGGGWEGQEPTLPGTSAGRGIIVGISDLWHDDEHDQAVRHAMTRELQGGYDLSTLHDAAQASSPTKPAREAREAERSLHAARSAARSLMEREATLPDLRARADRNRAQAARKSKIEAALKRLDLNERLSAERHELDALPEGAQRVSGKEDQRLRSLREAIDDAQNAIAHEHNSASKARADLNHLGLPEHGVPPGDAQLLTDLASELGAIERHLGEASRSAAMRQAEADATATTSQPLNAEELSKLEAALNAAHEAREQRARDKAAAEQWVPPTAPAPSKALPLAIVVTAVLTIIAAAIAGAWVVLGVAVVPAILAACLLVRRPDAVADPLPELRARAERSEAAYQRALQAVREFAGGDETLTSTLAIAAAVDRASRHDRILTELHAARASVESLTQQHGERLARAAACLSEYGDEPCASADDVARQLTNLKHRAQEHARLAREASQANQRASLAQQRLDKARRDYEAELDALGLTEDRLPELAEWLRSREPAQRLAAEVREHDAQLKSLDESLAEDKDLLRLDRSALETKLDECDAAGAQADVLREEIGGIEREIRNAKAGANVGEALAALERAARAVADARDHECAKAARRLVLDHAVAGMQRDDMPALVRQADRLLGRFTSNAYGLRIGERSEPAVYDLRAGRVKGYDQLSTGTRAQALLAMRLASAFEAERRARSTPLPLILDEPLATTDDQRFEAIARAIFELAGEGRQLVYLTCEPAHARRLEQLANEHKVPCERKDLDALRSGQATGRNPSAALVEPKPVPTPWTVSREAYLSWRGVEPLDPWARTDAIDLYHVLPEHLDTLHELKLRGITTVGQLTSSSLRDDEPSQFLEFVLAARVASRLIVAWRKGRARPLTRRDLADSFVGKSKYFEQVAETCDRVGGSAPALLHAVESGQVKGFGPNKAEQLRAWLDDQTLLPVAACESTADLIARALDGVVMGTSDQSHGF